MAVRRHSRIWKQQPQVAAKVADAVLNIPFGTVDIASGRSGTVNGSVNLSATPTGRANSFDGSSYLSFTGAILSATSPFTIALYEETINAKGYSGLFGTPCGANQLLWIRGSTGLYECAVGPAVGGGVAGFTGLGPQTAGEKKRFLLTGDALNNYSTYRLFADGVEYPNVGSSFGGVGAGTTNIGWDGADDKFDGKISDVLVIPRKFTDEEIRAYFKNPWQIFAPRSSRRLISSGGGSVNANASGAFSTVSVTAPTVSASGSASATGALAAITISAPTATASAGGSAAASGSFAALSITPATATATATTSATASGAFAAISLSATSATATATQSAAASGSFAVISLSAPTATATGTTAGGAIATCTPAQITISHAAAIAIGSAVASGGYQSIGITAPTGSASVGNGNATASGALSAISITAPAAYASSGFIRAPSGSGPTVIQPVSYRPSNTGGRRY